MPTTDIRHNQEARRWEATMDDRLVGVADYIDDGTVVTFTHTFVDPEVRGGAVASALIRSALDEAADRHRKVVPACSFVARYISRHSEYQKLLTG